MADPYTPSHPEFVVEFHEGDFRSFLRTRRAFAGGEILVHLTNATRSPQTYSTVQCGREPEDNVQFNSDFVFVNHSCEPNVVFDLSSPDAREWHIRALKDIEVGSSVTYFYPSTEWHMDQAFDCQCGTEGCLGKIQGARYLKREELMKYWVSPWISELIRERDTEIERR
ncbi:hypothetical protein R3P38DRAFT_2923279 [Favolaschia claudopus]|uniref:Post-SET domain-containing protein n=1 Tax=Favolaschia claudopus TaxID=2862362 RepID=A0AAW0BZA3_9AGAR